MLLMEQRNSQPQFCGKCCPEAMIFMKHGVKTSSWTGVLPLEDPFGPPMKGPIGNPHLICYFFIQNDCCMINYRFPFLLKTSTIGWHLAKLFLCNMFSMAIIVKICFLHDANINFQCNWWHRHRFRNWRAASFGGICPGSPGCTAVAKMPPSHHRWDFYGGWGFLWEDGSCC